MKNSNFLFYFIIVLIVVSTLSSCANRESVEICLDGHAYGFWGGLWHGFIAPFDLIGMIFWDDVTMYAQNNNGAFYGFGFLIGSGGWGFLGSESAKRRRE